MFNVDVRDTHDPDVFILVLKSNGRSSADLYEISRDNLESLDKKIDELRK